MTDKDTTKIHTPEGTIKVLKLTADDQLTLGTIGWSVQFKPNPFPKLGSYAIAFNPSKIPALKQANVKLHQLLNFKGVKPKFGGMFGDNPFVDPRIGDTRGGSGPVGGGADPGRIALMIDEEKSQPSMWWPQVPVTLHQDKPENLVEFEIGDQDNGFGLAFSSPEMPLKVRLRVKVAADDPIDLLTLTEPGTVNVHFHAGEHAAGPVEFELTSLNGDLKRWGAASYVL